MIDLISDKPTQGTIYLKGAKGYNNGVYLLNETCNTLYSNTNKKITARSMNIEDIQEKMDLTYWDYHNWTNGTVQYGESQDYSGNQKYPIQWKYDNGTAGESESRNLIPSTETTSETESNGNLTITQTHWNNKMSASYFKNTRTNESAVDGRSIYYTLLCDPTTTREGKYYWLASRCVDAGETSYIAFGMRCAGEAEVRNWNLFYSDESEGNRSNSIRPIVSIPSTMIDVTKGDGADTSSAFEIK